MNVCFMIGVFPPLGKIHKHTVTRKILFITEPSSVVGPFPIPSKMLHLRRQFDLVEHMTFKENICMFFFLLADHYPSVATTFI